MPSSDPVLRARGLTWISPRNHTILHELDLSLGRERVGLVGANGCGKTTLLRILAGDLPPTSGSIERPEPLAYLPQLPADPHRESVADVLGLAPLLDARERIDMGALDPALFELLEGRWDFENEARKHLAMFGLEGVSLQHPVDALSGGQAQALRLAALLARGGLSLLLLDEPTNHLDRHQKARVLERLAAWPEGLLVASHDRALLRCVDRILELSPRGLCEYGGGFELYRQQRQQQSAAIERRCEDGERRLKQERRAAQKRREKRDRTRSRARKGRGDGSQPKTVLDARKARSEKSGGRLKREAGQRLASARDALDAARALRERKRVIRPRIPGREVAAGRSLLEARDLVLAHPSGGFELRVPRLSLIGPERIALIGANGSGKSSLIAALCGELEPSSGDLRRPRSAAVLDQSASELDLDLSLLANLRAAAPKTELSSLRWTLARFGFGDKEVERPCGQLSGGERLRGALACILASDKAPSLLVLDEPTNNLDLASVENMAAALRSFAGALIVASHDDDFLEELELKRAWVLEAGRLRVTEF